MQCYIFKHFKTRPVELEAAGNGIARLEAADADAGTIGVARGGGLPKVLLDKSRLRLNALIGAKTVLQS